MGDANIPSDREAVSDRRLPQQNGKDGSIEVDIQGVVAVIHMRRGENRLNDSFFEQFSKALDQVESNEGLKVLITTGEGKFYSNGIDLDYLKAYTAIQPEYGALFQSKLVGLVRRILTFPLLTVAAVNGHAYAGGLLVALAHDYRVMNNHRGWLCMNEVHIGMMFTKSLLNLLRNKLPSGQVFNEAVVLGKRYSGTDALTSGIIQMTAPPQDVLPTAMKCASLLLAPRGYNRIHLHNMKVTVNQNVLEADKQTLKLEPMKSML